MGDAPYVDKAVLDADHPDVALFGNQALPIGAGPMPFGNPALRKMVPDLLDSKPSSIAVENLGEYKFGELLGRGAFGTVYKALNVVHGEFVAIKRLSFNGSGLTKKALGDMMAEIDMLRMLKHPNVVTYIGSHREEDVMNVIMEFVENGSLSQVVKKFGVFPEILLSVYTEQVLTGLAFLHSQNIIHRDIKGGNILVTREGTVKLADFGIATKLNEEMTRMHSVVGTPYWMAPEIIQMERPTTAADIWSLGCTVLELFTGFPPYYKLGPMQALFRMVEMEHPPLPSGISPEMRDFLLQCFNRHVRERSTARELLRHQWITKAKDGSGNGRKTPSVADLFASLSHIRVEGVDPPLMSINEMPPQQLQSPPHPSSVSPTHQVLNGGTATLASAVVGDVFEASKPQFECYVVPHALRGGESPVDEQQQQPRSRSFEQMYGSEPGIERPRAGSLLVGGRSAGVPHDNGHRTGFAGEHVMPSNGSYALLTQANGYGHNGSNGAFFGSAGQAPNGVVSPPASAHGNSPSDSEEDQTGTVTLIQCLEIMSALRQENKHLKRENRQLRSSLSQLMNGGAARGGGADEDRSQLRRENQMLLASIARLEQEIGLEKESARKKERNFKEELAFFETQLRQSPLMHERLSHYRDEIRDSEKMQGVPQPTSPTSSASSITPPRARGFPDTAEPRRDPQPSGQQGGLPGYRRWSNVAGLVRPAPPASHSYAAPRATEPGARPQASPPVHAYAAHPVTRTTAVAQTGGYAVPSPPPVPVHSRQELSPTKLRPTGFRLDAGADAQVPSASVGYRPDAVIYERTPSPTRRGGEALVRPVYVADLGQRSSAEHSPGSVPYNRQLGLAPPTPLFDEANKGVPTWLQQLKQLRAGRSQSDPPLPSFTPGELEMAEAAARRGEPSMSAAQERPENFRERLSFFEKP